MSDHISGPRALAEPTADITDVYAFPSPEHAGHLVMVMNTMPFAQPSDVFSEGLVYRFRIRALTAAQEAARGLFAVAAEEVTVDCVFSVPSIADDPRSQWGSCAVLSGGEVSFQVNDPQGGM